MSGPAAVTAGQYHQTRFAFDARRETLWRTLCDAYFQKLIDPAGCVLELGAGYAHFINNVRASRRIAVDLWDGLREFAAPGVETHIGSVTTLAAIADASVDFVFASNLFEHLTQSEFAAALAEVRRVLKPGGSINLLQPNYRLCANEYFDDYTHVAIWSDRSLADFLAAQGFEPVLVIPGLLPFSIKSRLPVIPALIRLYLALPVRPLAKQMFVRAVPK